MIDNFEILTAASVDEVGVEAWDCLSAGGPFQSAAWYRFSKQVMLDCSPIYIILSLDNQPVERGTFWLVRNEPLPVSPFIQRMLTPCLQRWSLLICRSPLANSFSLILPDVPWHENTLRVIAETAFRELRRLRGPFLLFDYLQPNQAKWNGWPAHSRPMVVSGPGTQLALRPSGFDGYLKSNKKFRIHQHFRRSSQEATDLGFQIRRQASFDGSASVLELIHNVERRHESSPNPRAAEMFAHMGMVESTWLTASIGDRLAGCILLQADGDAQIASLPCLT